MKSEKIVYSEYIKLAGETILFSVTKQWDATGETYRLETKATLHDGIEFSINSNCPPVMPTSFIKSTAETLCDIEDEARCFNTAFPVTEESQPDPIAAMRTVLRQVWNRWEAES